MGIYGNLYAYDEDFVIAIGVKNRRINSELQMGNPWGETSRGNHFSGDITFVCVCLLVRFLDVFYVSKNILSSQLRGRSRESGWCCEWCARV